MSGGVMAGILSFGAYIPRLRLQRQAAVAANSWFNPALKAQAKGVRAICNWDEDAVTMAVEAARDCLSGFDRTAVKSLQFASTTFPFRDRLNAGIVAEALNIASGVAALDVAATQRAGTSALMSALIGGGPTLVVAA
jgi:hydroxymethylglutaryl-CoA synthase